ncbi:hypothetical protein ACFSHT_01695 [Paraburkholderia silviterrae]|uniref:Uncharacterized protein n=1 Tax=Paraburkholderia silviterrae TaxID=2528715 RepID=A0A4V2ZZQ1_9BURK|nr:hypothetical protein [Paraburkholderia silviterrae]TDG26314.1 hypothetical protein EYW47_02895 [Paraburkholderia silviterrae]
MRVYFLADRQSVRQAGHRPVRIKRRGEAKPASPFDPNRVESNYQNDSCKFGKGILPKITDSLSPGAAIPGEKRRLQTFNVLCQPRIMA